MLQTTIAQPPKTEDLSATAYQFALLYKQWCQNMQAFEKQGAEIAASFKTFTQHVEQFKTLEPSVREQIRISINNATVGIAQSTRDAAENAVEPATIRLSNAARNAEHVLSEYKTAVITTQWKVIGAGLFTTIITSLLIVWLLIPSPTLPLTREQVKALNSGQLLEYVWPKLTEKERDRWLAIADKEINVQKKKLSRLEKK